jgi:hypothetical protein
MRTGKPGRKGSRFSPMLFSKQRNRRAVPTTNAADGRLAVVEPPRLNADVALLNE